MIVPQAFAVLFARTLDLFRDPDAKEDQKLQFRALVGLLRADAVTLTADAGRVLLNGTPIASAGGGGPCAALVQRMELHAVEEITIPADPPPRQVFELLKALADQPGQDDIRTRLKASGVERIAVAVHTPVGRPPAAVAPDVAPAPKLDLGTDGILRSDMDDNSSVPRAVPVVSDEVKAAPVAADLRAGAPAAATSRSARDLLAELLGSPKGPHAGDLLGVLSRQFETAMRANRLEQALEIVAGVVRAEQQVGEDGPRRQYSIALKRMYTKRLLGGIARLAGKPDLREDALLALQRAGADGVEVLLDLLVAAPTIEERRGVFTALTQVREGTDQLVHMLGHHEWFVVRNIAELAGELALDEAVPALARQLDHPDERVRMAIALALAKIGSRAAADPLRRALKDPSPAVRIQAALGVGGQRSNALAMPLVVAMGEEEDEAVEQELMLALGRIGSPDAVQALIKFAQPGGKLFGRKPTALRVTAVEALRLAATPAAVGTLEGLAADGDRPVRAAAEAALADLKRK
jgi:HEAT repeat protein